MTDKTEHEEMTAAEMAYYQKGRAARAEDKQVWECDVITVTLKCYWLAGWHDQDYEMGNRVYKGPERLRRIEDEAA